MKAESQYINASYRRPALDGDFMKRMFLSREVPIVPEINISPHVSVRVEANQKLETHLYEANGWHCHGPAAGQETADQPLFRADVTKREGI